MTEWNQHDTAEDVINREYDGGLPADKLIQSKTEAESSVISRLLHHMKLSTLLDLGVWHGFLLEATLKSARPHRIIAVDAVEAFIQSARRRIGTLATVEWCHALVVPSGQADQQHAVRVDPTDTSKTGIQVKRGPLVTIPQQVTVRQLLQQFELIQEVSSTYVKIDLEGVDLGVVQDFLMLEQLPAVIHFEIVARERMNYSAVVALLADRGFETVDVLPGEHRFHSVACSRSQAAVIGFEPQRVYWKFPS